MDTSREIAELMPWVPLFSLILIFYMLSCGIEGMFHSTIYTVALCGPLRLVPKKAVIANNVFFGGFTAGRTSGTFIAGLWKPKNMATFSLVNTVP